MKVFEPIALIPARGGSKRIHRKNLKKFHGVPIIGRSIKTALDSKCFSRVIVSTDDPEIAEISRDFGAEVPFMRPASLANDFATTDDVLNHAINWLTTHAISLEYLCCLYPTAPLLSSEDLVQGYKILRDTNATTAISVTEYPFPIQRALQLTNNRLRMVDSAMRLIRSQDLEMRWHDAGAFYWLHVPSYLKSALYNNNMVPVILPRIRVVDIDTIEDWHYAEALYQLINKKNT